jgi:LysR family transcriptional regulator (chromosome initiation inhibitor)
MLDYAAIAALHAVIETQGFRQAAEKLFVTQSAISQRIKTLENNYGEPVLMRTLPYRPTPLGLVLLGHYKRVLLLEDSLDENLSSRIHHPNISIAISRDSLETWFLEVIRELQTMQQPIKLEIIADDQDHTLNYLQNGLVSGCVSTNAKTLSGCKVDLIGYFDYVMVASKEFKKKYFNNKNLVENFLHAPAVIFDHKDRLHTKYLKHFFNISDANIQYHVVPSVTGFRHFAINGLALALIPEIDILKELKEKKLINLFPDKVWKMPLYWHRWTVETKSYKLFNELILKVGKKILRQP